MSTSELQEGQADAPQEKQPLKLSVKVDKPEPCLRHVVVTIPREEVQRYEQKAFDGLVHEAQVPGFRPGRAPRKLVERHFRERVEEQVKGSLLMDSLTQVTEQEDFSAISEPDFDFESIELPEDGDFTYEFKVEVRPEFETPDWKGLKLKRPVEEIDEARIDAAVNRILRRYATTEPTDQPAELGDELLLTAKFSHDGKHLSDMDEERVPLRPVLSFPDARCEEFGQLLTGAKEGESRRGHVIISESVDDEALQGKTVEADFHLVEVLRSHLPELTESFLRELGDFASKDELREFVRESLQRQAQYRERDALRKQVVEQLTADAAFDLPPDLVRRQTRRELERKTLELRRSGFDDETIQRIANLMRQNARAATEAALREHFVLEQIAEEQKVDAEPGDYDEEIQLIAEQSDMPARRVRARLEKSGQMDALRNQIIERKVVEMITAAAELADEPVSETEDEDSEAAISHPVVGGTPDEAIPEAKYDDTNRGEGGLPGQGQERESRGE